MRISGLAPSAAAHHSTSETPARRGAAPRRNARYPAKAISSGNGPNNQVMVGSTITSVRGWRGAFCANQAAPSSTMSHCSQ